MRPFLFLFLLFLLLSGCSFPKIIVLKDSLAPEEHLNLGVAYENRGELDNAIREYRLASKELPLGYLYLGNAHFLKNELTEAERNYRKAIKKDPLNGDAYNNLAWLYFTKGEKLDEAEALALRALELNPRKNDIYRDTLEKIREKNSKN
jgi:tetratricopeptide (TPR) repeat protein